MVTRVWDGVGPVPCSPDGILHRVQAADGILHRVQAAVATADVSGSHAVDPLLQCVQLLYVGQPRLCWPFGCVAFAAPGLAPACLFPFPCRLDLSAPTGLNVARNGSGGF